MPSGRVYRCVLRVWLPDRPGALGAVASRIGAVRGDLVGIDILERGGGRAIDELIVELPDRALVPLLVSEVAEVDGVDIEDVRPITREVADPRLDVLEMAAGLLAHDQIDALLDEVVRGAVRDFDARWAAVACPGTPLPLARTGPCPPAEWISAFAAGSAVAMPAGAARHAAGVQGGETGPPRQPQDMAWAELEAAGLTLLLGRDGRPFRARERRQLAALARIVDCRWRELASRTTCLRRTESLPGGVDDGRPGAPQASSQRDALASARRHPV